MQLCLRGVNIAFIGIVIFPHFSTGITGMSFLKKKTKTISTWKKPAHLNLKRQISMRFQQQSIATPRANIKDRQRTKGGRAISRNRLMKKKMFEMLISNFLILHVFYHKLQQALKGNLNGTVTFYTLPKFGLSESIILLYQI